MMRTTVVAATLLLAACAETAPEDAATDDAAPAAVAERAGPATANEPAGAAAGDTAALAAAVRAAVQADNMDPADAPFRSAFIDLNGDGIADGLALMQRGFCGTGGCTLFVFEGGADGYTLDSSISLVRGPLVVTESRTGGWRDIGLVVSGGGMAAKTVVLRHSDGGYPGNPSTIDAAAAPTFEGDVLLSRFADRDLDRFADFVGQRPHESDLWNRPFLADRLRPLLYSHYDAFIARMETVAPVQVENGVYFITGSMNEMGGSDAAILVADPAHNVLKAWVWQNGDLTEFSEAPVTISLPNDVAAVIRNMEGQVTALPEDAVGVVRVEHAEDVRPVRSKAAAARP